MKRFLACIATAIAVCLPSGFVWADEDNSAGQVRLQDDTAPPPPIPYQIGSDSDSGRVSVNDGLPTAPPMYEEYVGGNRASTGILPRSGFDPFLVQYRLNRRFGGLYGYDEGYTDIGAFIPRIVDENTLFFIDLRGFVTDNQDGGFNLGLGRRSYNDYADRVWSNSLWLDYDGGHVKQYLRGGYSGSMTSRYWRYRWNGYWIMGDHSNFVDQSIGATPSFTGNNIVVDRQRTREVAYSGVDATIGGPIPLLGQYGLNWDFGVYYNGAEFGKDSVGFLAKADAQITEDVQLGVTYANDATFGTNAQVFLSLNLPDGRPSRILRQPRVHDYMLRSDDRNYRVNTRRYQVDDQLSLQDICNTGGDVTVAHIAPAMDDNAAPSGDGSIENPFNSLAAWNALTPAEKAAFNIVYVQPGTTPTGAEFDNNLNSGITIVENQRLLASTGRLVRIFDDNGDDSFLYTNHTVAGVVPGVGEMQFNMPEITGLANPLAGTTFDPNNDFRPILSNDTPTDPNTQFAVVTIDNSIAADCGITEVSGFVINGANPNLPNNRNIGIVSGIYGDPLADRAITSFDINSNYIRNVVHGVNIISSDSSLGFLTDQGEAVARVDTNQIEGDGFFSNSGIHIEHIAGTLNLAVQDNLVYGFYGEDMDNDGNLDVVNLPGGTEDINGNGKLDPGEDLNFDGLLSVSEDNDKDGIIGDDDHGIGINVIASNGSIINANTPDVTLLDGTVIRGFNISRNTTYVDEAELGRDVNGYVNRDNINTADTLDIVGNRSGMNLEARGGAVFTASVADNDTSFNNPYSDVNAQGNYVPPQKNQDLVDIPPPRLPQLPFVPNPNGDGLPGDPTDPIFGNGFGFRAAATGAGSIMNLNSPDRHRSNSNYGTGAVLSARDGGFLNMLTPMMGEVEINADGLITNVIAPSEFNNNGLNGLLITGDGAGSSLAIQVGVPLGNFIQDNALTVGVNEAANVDDIFERILNQFNSNGQHFISGTSPDAFENGSGMVISLKNNAAIVPNSNNVPSGIFHAQSNSNQGNGLLIDLGDDTNGALLQNFTIGYNDFSGNAIDGISVSAENGNLAVAPGDLNNGIGALHNLLITNNVISAFGTNGINFQNVNSDLTNLFIGDNIITSNQVSPGIESLFDIELVFGNGFSPSQIATIQAAADRWSEVIVGDLPDVVFNGETIDDIRITMDIAAIDGNLGILALGGFSFANIRNDATELPFLSSVTYDVADMNFMETSNILFDVALHEMGHALGFLAPFWQRPSQDHVAFTNPTTPIFTGTNALAEHNALFGVTATGVPLQSGGNNVAGSHWDEPVYGNEIMTPLIGAAPNPLSRVTVALMSDLGYTVNLNAADPFAPSMAPGTVLEGVTFSNGTVLNTPGVGPFTLQTNVDAIVVIDPDVFDTTSTSSGNGINLSLQNSNLVNANIVRNEITDVGGDGIRMINPQFRTNSLVTRNDPLVFNPPGTDPPFNGADNMLHIQLNEITGSGRHGVDIALNNDNQLDMIICVNNISDNELGGINVELADNAIYRNGVVDTTIVDDPTTPQIEGETSFFFGNTVNNNGGIGYHIVAENNSQFTVVGSRPTQSTFVGNEDAGIGIEMFDDTAGDFRMDNVIISDTTDGAGSVFDGQGLGIVLRNQSQLNNFRLGDPLLINPNSPAGLNPVSTIVRNNATDGVNIQLFGSTQLLSGLISQSSITGNGRDGVSITRNQSGAVGDILNVLPAGNAPPATSPDAPDPAFVIRQSTITGNTQHGVNVAALQANTNDEYVLLLSDVSNNGVNGINLFTQGNAGLLFDVRQNTVSNNGLHGLFQATDIINPFQTTGYTGTIVGNVFDSNGGDGIQLAGIYGRLNNPAGTGNVPRPVQIGSLFTEDVNFNNFLDPGEDLDGDGRLDRDRNLITNNGGVGINLLGSGTTNITNNLIDDNGSTGINVTDGNVTTITDNTISNNDLHGIAMTSTADVTASIVATINNNAILDNARDGVQIVATLSEGANSNTTNFLVEQVQVTMNRNLIADNGGRGIDTTVRGDGAAFVSITDVVVSGNQEAGIYNLVTASTTQDVEALASADLAQDGSIFANAFLDFRINALGPGLTRVGGDRGPNVNFGAQNQIVNNNSGDTYDGGGLVFRVGTTGAISGLAQPWAPENTVDPRLLGGLLASIEDTNTINNNGVDFWIHTFTSTVNPATTGGTWTDQNTNPRVPGNDVFNPTGYQQDPLARIRIEALDDMSGGSADVFGFSRAFNTASNQNFAFYNNAEAEFKSRGITGVSSDTPTDGGLDDNGPFTTGTRPRNATRLASRTGFTIYDTVGGVTNAVPGAALPPGLTIIQAGRNSDDFLYPGLGLSTMQMTAGGDFALLNFNTVITNFNSDVGFSQGNGLAIGLGRDTDYLWQVFP